MSEALLSQRGKHGVGTDSDSGTSVRPGPDPFGCGHPMLIQAAALLRERTPSRKTELGTADEQAGQEDQDAANHDLKRRSERRRVHEPLPNS